jgi:hypothetical protein
VDGLVPQGDPAIDRRARALELQSGTDGFRIGAADAHHL